MMISEGYVLWKDASPLCTHTQSSHFLSARHCPGLRHSQGKDHSSLCGLDSHLQEVAWWDSQ